MHVRNPFRRGKPPEKLPAGWHTGSSSHITSVDALCQPDILLSIAACLDASSLCSLRLVNRSINATIAEHESWICRNIVKNEYGWVFEYDDASFRDPKNYPAHLSEFTTFKALTRLSLSTLLPILLLWNQFKSTDDGEATLIIPDKKVNAACARGFLTLWALADIEREVEQTSSIWQPRQEWCEFSRTARPFINPNEGPPDDERARQILSEKPSKTSRLRGLIPLASRRETQEPGHRATLVNRLTYRRQPPSPIPLPEGFQRHELSRTKRLALIAQLDQGSWLDLHIVTTLVLAFFVSYTDSEPCRTLFPRAKIDPQPRPQTAGKLWCVEWSVRQGPELILSILSSRQAGRDAAIAWIKANWASRDTELQALDGTFHTTGPLGISTTFSGRYPHPKCTSWEADGWPTLVDCTKQLLFREWRTLELKDNPAAKVLAAALAQRTGDVSFQTRM